MDGFALSARGSIRNSRDRAFAYLDKGTAGLGVCKVLNGSNQCNPSNDDNATLGEVLRIDFNKTVSININDLVFRDEKHNIMGNASLDQLFLNIPGDGNSPQDIASLVGMTVSGENFRFFTSASSQQFYLSSVSAVPIPAAAWLFGSALVGLAGIGRRKKMS